MKHCLIIAAIMLVVATCAVAADGPTATQTFNTKVNAMAVLHTNGDPTPNLLELVAPATGGVVPADVTSTSSLAYTNVQATPFKIGAAITSGSVPAGTLLKVVSAAPAAQYGAPGTAEAQITLDATSKPVISAIGSCATGTGAGAELTYTFGVDPTNWAELVPAASAPITVTYTLSSTGG